MFKTILVGIVVVLLEFLGYIGMAFKSRSLDFLSNKHYFQIRGMLMGNLNPELSPRYLSIPYLGYIPYPNYTKHGIIQHNEDGYRGNKVQLSKTNKYRILCIGGSTTYGYGVDSPQQTYPAQLQQLLNSYPWNENLKQKGYAGAEVINAGVEAATSAEELQQYLFKYRYFKPNIVIVHSGINDAQLVSLADSNFQLDYTHYRRINFHLEPLSQPIRTLMHSYFVSFLIIRLFFDDFSGRSGDEFGHQGLQTYSKWTHIKIDQIVKEQKFDLYPFYMNTKSLYTEIINDSAVLVIFPNALNTNISHDTLYQNFTQLNASISKNLGEYFGAVFIPSTLNSIGSTFWIDDCHLNADGERKKAEIVCPYIITIVKNEK